jgi:microcystin-dependent protein
MAAPRYDSIPEPTEDPGALLASVKALKATVDQLTGNTGRISPVTGTSASPPPQAPSRNFYQRATPDAQQIGDTWTKPSNIVGDNAVSSTWDGKQWVPDGGGSGGSGSGVIPSGLMGAFAGLSGAVPGGWILSFGQAVSRTNFAALFRAIGTLYGVGDGSTTFNVPDMRGVVIAGSGNMGGTERGILNSVISSAPGSSGGSQFLHAHGHSEGAHSHGILRGAGVPGITTPRGVFGDGTAASVSGSTENGNGAGTGATGSGGSQNVQPTIIMNWMIKT